jgi:NitT/TauT family transport system substrate-binding protein
MSPCRHREIRHRRDNPQNMLRRSAFLTSIAALTTVAPRAAVAQALAPLRATSAIDDAATPFMYALDSGLFRKNGLDASLERSTSGAAATSAVVGGSFELGKSSVVSLLSAHLRGLPIVAVAPAGDYDIANSTAQIAVRADGPLHTGADFDGKIVAVSALNDSFSLGVRSWVDAHGGSAATVKLIELPMGSAVAAIIAGRIDAAVLGQPFVRPAASNPAIRLVGDPLSALGNHHTDSAWFTTIAYAQANPDVVSRFMQTIRQAAIYANGHHPETAALLAKYSGAPVSDVLNGRVPAGVRFDPASVQIMIDAAARYKLIPQRFDAKDLIYANALH